MLFRMFFLIPYLSLSSVFKFILKSFIGGCALLNDCIQNRNFVFFKNHIFLKQVGMGSWGYLKKTQHDSRQTGPFPAFIEDANKEDKTKLISKLHPDSEANFLDELLKEGN